MSVALVILVVLIAIGTTIAIAISIAVLRLYKLFDRPNQVPKVIQELPMFKGELDTNKQVGIHIYTHMSGGYSLIYSKSYTISAGEYNASSLAEELNSKLGGFIRSTYFNDKLQSVVDTDKQVGRYEDVFQIYFPVTIRYYTVVAKRLSRNSASRYTIVLFIPTKILQILGSKAKNGSITGFDADIKYPDALAINLQLTSRTRKVRLIEI